MCGVIGRCIGGQGTACKWMNLRTFMLFWLFVYGIVAAFELVAGSYLSSLRGIVDEILDKLRLIANSGEHEGVGDYYYDILRASFATLWKTGTILTATRGCIDVVAGVLGAYGMWKGRRGLLYTFLAVNVINFFIDFVLFLASMILINTLYITWFYPIASVVPFALYGWLALAGPYVSTLILSYIWVVEVGGNGSEGKAYYELEEEKKKTGTESPAMRFLLALAACLVREDEKTGGAEDTGAMTDAGEDAPEEKPLLKTANAEKDIEAATGAA
ncbi:hypothetical protein BESB_006490 [Besnoitia besnoiti]|uniref:Transmembrane protein n=1 Tax=Besnoitia besnoiti TaxID=94643 RepID=A0A2A9MIE3_BESBE|nr:hypothetical protein BESB_006490 [Besnoitia besnoiti]PFH38308.1 hypothetical protein BESB_006490 [Besnoitia besnoiti]